MAVLFITRNRKKLTFRSTSNVIRGNLARAPKQNPWLRDANVITSLQFARGQISPAHQAAGRNRSGAAAEARWIDEVEWDLVIFDEAHHLRRYLKGGALANGREVTQSYRLAQALEERTRSLLLLTATPLQLTEYDAYSLFELIDPTLFPNYERFLDYITRLGRQHWQALGEFDRALHALESQRHAEANPHIAQQFWQALITCRKLVLQREVGHVIREGRAGRKGSDMPIRLLGALDGTACRRPWFRARKTPKRPRFSRLFAPGVDQLRVVILVFPREVGHVIREGREGRKGSDVPVGFTGNTCGRDGKNVHGCAYSIAHLCLYVTRFGLPTVGRRGKRRGSGGRGLRA